MHLMNLPVWSYLCPQIASLLLRFTFFFFPAFSTYLPLFLLGRIETSYRFYASGDYVLLFPFCFFLDLLVFSSGFTFFSTFFLPPEAMLTFLIVFLSAPSLS